MATPMCGALGRIARFRLRPRTWHRRDRQFHRAQGGLAEPERLMALRCVRATMNLMVRRALLRSSRTMGREGCLGPAVSSRHRAPRRSERIVVLSGLAADTGETVFGGFVLRPQADGAGIGSCGLGLVAET